MAAMGDEEVEAIMSIYPELSVNNSMATFTLALTPDRPIKISLMSPQGQSLDDITANAVEPLVVRFSLDFRTILLESWIRPDVLQKIKLRLSQCIMDGEMPLYQLCEYTASELALEFSHEMYEGYTIRTTDFARFKMLALMSERSRIRAFEEGTFHCSICLGTYRGVEGVLLHCNHSFCKTCLQEIVKRGMKEVTKLQCPNCPIELLGNHTSKSLSEVKRIMFTERMTKEDLLNVLTLEEYTGYSQRRLTTLFEEFHSLYPIAASNCPRCHVWMFHDDPDDALMRCRKCSLAYCFYCKHSWHGTTNECGRDLHRIPQDIIDLLMESPDPGIRQHYEKLYGVRTVKAALEDEADRREMLELVGETEDTLLCPQCGLAVTKLDGCNKMLCVCGQNFCFLCGVDLFKSNPYTHFNDYRSPCYGRLFEGLET